MAKTAKKLTAKGTFKTKKAKFEVQVPVFEFTEDDVEIIYCPSLDLSGYGRTLKEAERSFEIVLGEFLDYTTTKGTLIKELKSLGWKTKAHNASIKGPELSALLVSNELLRGIVNAQKDFRVTQRPIHLSIAA
ncbi:MAG: hypothetical protein Q8916_04080 [Bacteroidota bacterium]|nr:hypothetical protein [Bacteroidota bacterium]MDP4235097.1 hypothetical protein [Bacteroidota bacterium]